MHLLHIFYKGGNILLVLVRPLLFCMYIFTKVYQVLVYKVSSNKINFSYREESCGYTFSVKAIRCSVKFTKRKPIKQILLLV